MVEPSFPSPLSALPSLSSLSSLSYVQIWFKFFCSIFLRETLLKRRLVRVSITLSISGIQHWMPDEAGAPAIEKKSLPRQPPIPAGFTPRFPFLVRLTTQTPKRPLERGVTDFVFDRLGLNASCKKSSPSIPIGSASQTIFPSCRKNAKPSRFIL